jgi:hypothetical protein
MAALTLRFSICLKVQLCYCDLQSVLPLDYTTKALVRWRELSQLLKGILDFLLKDLSLTISSATSAGNFTIHLNFTDSIPPHAESLTVMGYSTAVSAVTMDPKNSDP